MKSFFIKFPNNRRGTIGIEAGILMIGVVIVAAGLAVVITNSGFETSQKAKTTIGHGLSDSSGMLKIAGRVFASGHIASSKLNVTAIPLKIAEGANSVNLAESNTAVKYLSNDGELSEIYQGTINPGVETSLQSATASAAFFSYIDQNPFLDNAHPTQTSAFVYWAVNDNDNDILDRGERAFLVIVFSQNDRPSLLDRMQVDVSLARGSTFTVERSIPVINSQNIDLG